MAIIAKEALLGAVVVTQVAVIRLNYAQTHMLERMI